MFLEENQVWCRLGIEVNRTTFWFSRGVPLTARSAFMGTLSGCSGRVAKVCSSPTRSSSASPSPIIPPVHTVRRARFTYQQIKCSIVKCTEMYVYIYIYMMREKKRRCHVSNDGCLKIGIAPEHTLIPASRTSSSVFSRSSYDRVVIIFG